MSEQDKEVDLESRDPNSLNGHVQVAFEDVLGEPDTTHSIDCVWKNSYSCFNCGKNCCYKFMSTLCGICIALYWGCEFAMITFQMVWCCTPSLKVHTIMLGICQRFFGSCIQCCLAPLCETMGLCFSNITITKK
ncbi:Caveolin-1 [Mizuhopecten yessoensis]|uniref:Caveolin n=1 Tax=Mizuhopecten yessoensis TaxID=6573 RepID=A0A210PEX1_MIZYE|nr:Caveolin-1 [Mizuhopecten yessoensis]